jgi:plastocyanin
MRLFATGLAVLLLTSPAYAAAPRTHQVVIAQMKFGAIPANVRAGDKIVWVNRDMFRHTATAKAAGFDLDLAPGATKAAIVNRSGTFTVTCRYHPGMKANLKVAK